MADSQADEVKSQIIMKVDSPADEPEDEEKEDNEAIEDLIPNNICSPLAKPVLAPSRFGRALIRPSQFGQPSKFNNFNFSPRKLNPFMKAGEGNGCEKVASSTTNGETPKFMPLLQTEKSNDVKPTNSIAQGQANHSFVFGQNLKERVLTEDGDEPQPSTSVSTNGNQGDDMLFSSVIKDAPNILDNATPSKSLSESAREYEELRANKRKYEEVEVKTGEEDETNVLHISCKLFAFDKTVGNWQERGRGNLRLNDLQIRENESTYTQSRLVFRSAGVLKVVLNTKIWAEMTIEQASAKSIRFTALDSSGEIKVFLVMANPEEAKMLFKSLQERLGNEQRRQNLKKSNTSDETTQPASDSG